MTQFDDFQYNPPPSSSSNGSPRWQSIAIVVGGVALVTAAIVAVYLINRGPTETVPSEAQFVIEPPPSEIGVTEPSDPEPDGPETVNLPALDESDGFVRDLVSTLSAHPTLVAWFATEELIRTFVVVVENIAEGQTPARHLGDLSLKEPFRTAGDRQQLVINPLSYARYDLIADAFNSVHIEGAVQLYEQLRPLLDDAYRDLGHPDGDFRQALAQAVRQIVEVPIVDGEIALVSRTVAFQFADVSLERLAPVQRQALRMGSRNLRLVQQKLHELSSALGLEASVTVG
jgi:hypothetical protein